jgi:uncharacterized protein
MIRFEWHETKSRSHEKKHSLDFETARSVFDDPHCISFIERFSGGEERGHTIGSIENIIVIVAVHTYREEAPDEVIRIISARRATRYERNLYAQANS